MGAVFVIQSFKSVCFLFDIEENALLLNLETVQLLRGDAILNHLCDIG